jgi:uncharacterized protein
MTLAKGSGASPGFRSDATSTGGPPPLSFRRPRRSALVASSCLFRSAFAAAAILCLSAFAAADLPVPPLQGRPVVDAAIRELQAATTGQMAVLTITTLSGEALETYSLRVAETWGIGHRGRDDGAVLLIVRDDRRLRLEVGYGWEGAINDARAGDILRGMGDILRAGRAADAAIYAVQQVQAFVSGVPASGAAAPKPFPDDKYPSDGPLPFLVVLGVWIVFIMLLRSFGGRGQRGYTIHGGGGFGRSSGGSSWSGGSSFSGGGGSFGGGGASGRW